MKVVMKLFSFLNFYVEILSDKKNDRVIMINAFDDTECLQPYLDQIDISDLAMNNR